MSNTFPKSIVRGTLADADAGDQTYGALNEAYAGYYKCGSAKKGVFEIISCGKFYINGTPLPSDGDKLKAAYPGGFPINNRPGLIPVPGGWTNGGMGPGARTFTEYEEAVEAFLLDRLVNGLETLLYDDDGDGFADRAETMVYNTVQANRIINNPDGTHTIEQGEFSCGAKIPPRYIKFMSEPRDFPLGKNIPDDCFDPAIDEGCECVFWQAPDGRFHFRRAQEARGVFIKGRDHSSYYLGDKFFPDAMRFPRSMLVCSRCGGYANFMQYFGFNNNPGRISSLWLSPVSEYAEAPGAPIGFTNNENAADFLRMAIEIARGKMASAFPSVDGSDAPAGSLWVKQALYDELESAIAMAEDVLSKETRSSFLDLQSYMLYVTLAGTKEDISASFMGYDFEGFTGNCSPTYVLKRIDGGKYAKLSESDISACFDIPADDGVREIAAAGRVYVNNYPLGTSGSFEINGETAVCFNGDNSSWQLHGSVPYASGTGSAADCACSFAQALVTVPGATVDLIAPTGSKKAVEIRAFIPLRGGISFAGGNFRFLEFLDANGKPLCDLSGNVIKFNKKYAEGYDHGRPYKENVIYYKDANTGHGEWTLRNADGIQHKKMPPPPPQRP